MIILVDVFSFKQGYSN